MRRSYSSITASFVALTMSINCLQLTCTSYGSVITAYEDRVRHLFRRDVLSPTESTLPLNTTLSDNATRSFDGNVTPTTTSSRSGDNTTTTMLQSTTITTINEIALTTNTTTKPNISSTAFVVQSSPAESSSTTVSSAETATSSSPVTSSSTSTIASVTSTTRDNNGSVGIMTTTLLLTPSTSTIAFQSPTSTSLSATESTALTGSSSTSTATTTTSVQSSSSTQVSISVASTDGAATSSSSAPTTTRTPLVSPSTTTTPMTSSSTAVASNLSTITNSSAATPLVGPATTTTATDNRTSTTATVADGANKTVTDVTTGCCVNVSSTVKATTVGSVSDSTLVDRASDNNNTRTQSSVAFSTGATFTSGGHTTAAVTDSTSTAPTVAHTSLTTTIASITTSAKQQITTENTTTSSNVLISSSTTAPTTLPSTSANGTTSTTTTTTAVQTTLVTSSPTLGTPWLNSSSTPTTTTSSEQQSQAFSTTTTTTTTHTTSTTTTAAAPTSSSPSSEEENLSTSPNNDTLFATTSSRTLLLTTSTTEPSPPNFMLAIYIAVPAAGTLIIICCIAAVVVCVIRRRKKNKNKHKRLETTTSSESYAMHRRGAGNVYGNGVLRSRSEMSLSSMSTKPDESGYDVIDLAAVCDVGFGTRTGSALGGDGDRLAYRPRLPVDLRSAAPSVAGSDRRSGINVAGVVERRSSADEIRDLTVSLLELKHRLEEYVQTGVHLERRPIPSSNSLVSSQYQLISAISDVSSRISDAISRYQLQTNLPESIKPLTQPQTAWNVPPDLVAPAFLVEHLMTLRPRIDRLARLLARSVRAQPSHWNGSSENGGQPRDPLSSLQQHQPPGTVEVSTLTTVLANVGASVTMAIESIAEICRDDQYILLPPSTGRNGARTPRTSIGYERVRRPPASRNGGRPYRIRVPTDRCSDVDRDIIHSDPINQLKSLIGELAVVRCRLQTLSELDPEQSIDDVGGDIWWQAGLVSSLDKLTDYLVDLVKYDDAASATDNSSSVTSHGSLRVTGANFDQLLSEKLAAFQRAAERVILSSSFGRRPPWDLDTWQMVLNLLRATLDVSRIPRRPHPPETIRSLRRHHQHHSQHPNLIDFVRENRAATTSTSGGSVSGSTGPNSTMVRISNEPDIGRHTLPQGQTPSVATAGSSSRSWLVSGNGSRNSRSTGAAAGSSRSRLSGAHGGVMPSSSASQSSQSNRLPEISRLFEMNPAASSVRSVSRPGSEMTFVVSETDTAEIPDFDFSEEIEDLAAAEQTDAGEDDMESLFEVVIDRTSPESLLDNVFTLYDQTPIDQLRRQVKVTFHNELGVDAGALSREFFFLIFEALASGRTVRSRSAFHGARGHLLPSIDHVLTESRVFWFVGVLLVQSVQRGCHGLPGLCDAVRHFLAAGARISTIGRSLSLVTMEDVADLELRAILTKMQNNKDLSDSEQSVQERWLDEAKFTRPLNSSTMREAVQRIICHYIFDSRMVQLQAIAEGMAEMGYQVGEEQEEVINNMFPRDSKLTVIDFMNGIVFDDGVDDRYDQQSSMSAGTETGSDSGGSRMGTASRCSRADIQRTMQYFRRYIDDVYNGKIGKLKLEDILQFINGAPYFSSMSAATVRFDSTSSMPHAHACSSEIVLPARHRSYRGFRMALTNAFEYGALGFGNA